QARRNRGQGGRVVAAQDVDDRVRHAHLIAGVAVRAARGHHTPAEPSGLALAGAVRDVLTQRAILESRYALGRSVDATDAKFERAAAPPLFGARELLTAVVQRRAARPA